VEGRSSTRGRQRGIACSLKWPRRGRGSPFHLPAPLPDRQPSPGRDSTTLTSLGSLGASPIPPPLHESNPSVDLSPERSATNPQRKGERLGIEFLIHPREGDLTPSPWRSTLLTVYTISLSTCMGGEGPREVSVKRGEPSTKQ
jgi:hypothetical protein